MDASEPLLRDPFRELGVERVYLEGDSERRPCLYEDDSLELGDGLAAARRCQGGGLRGVWQTVGGAKTGVGLAINPPAVVVVIAAVAVNVVVELNIVGVAERAGVECPYNDPPDKGTIVEIEVLDCECE